MVQRFLYYPLVFIKANDDIFSCQQTVEGRSGYVVHYKMYRVFIRKFTRLRMCGIEFSCATSANGSLAKHVSEKLMNF